MPAAQTNPWAPAPKSSQRWIAPLEFIAIACLLLLVWARRGLEILVLELSKQDGTDVSGLERARPHPIQFDVGVSFVLLVAGVCALWTWRRAHSIRPPDPRLRRVVMARQIIVILIALVVAHSFVTWGRG